MSRVRVMVRLCGHHAKSIRERRDVLVARGLTDDAASRQAIQERFEPTCTWCGHEVIGPEETPS
jgi:hypothetical protein